MEAAIIFHNAKIPTNLRTCDQQPHSLVRNSMWLFRTYRAPLELRSRQRGGSPHYYGEAHAEVYISRWFESVCSPPKPSFKGSSALSVQLQTKSSELTYASQQLGWSWQEKPKG